MKVLHNKVPIQFYKEGGKVLKMQTAPGGQIPGTKVTIDGVEYDLNTITD
jgi:hypothetical protein